MLSGCDRDRSPRVRRQVIERTSHRGEDALECREDHVVPSALDTWNVSLALPGISPDKVDLDIAGRTLRVRGERSANDKAQPVISEITYGRFEREFTLPEEIDAQRVEATYRHGMLELVLPLAEGAKPHRIAVKSAPEGKQLHAA